VLTLLLVALALGLSNFAAAIGIGLSGIDQRARLRVGIVFGLFEVSLPILGLAIGRALVHALGGATRWIGACLLVATGVYILIEVVRKQAEDAPARLHPSLRRPAVTALALSIDNLAIGFAIGTHHVPLLLAAALIGAISVGLSLIDLELPA